MVQDRWKLSRRYGIFATPVAFLSGEDRRVVRPVIVGVAQIEKLLSEEFPSGIGERINETASTIS